jgi:hypothetical protein
LTRCERLFDTPEQECTLNQEVIIMIRCRPFFAFLSSVFLVMGFMSTLALFAQAAHASPTLSLEQPVYFLSPDEEPLLINPGTYEIEAAEAWLKLIPHAGGRTEALLLNAQSGTHGEKLATPKVLLTPIEEQPDLRQLTLLLPDGTGLEAVGSTSGVWPRALRKSRLSRSLLQRKQSILSQRVAPTTQRPATPSGPDLVITSYDVQTNVLQVKNIGNAPAVFSQGGPLVSWFTNAPGNNVPAGGVIQPGQTITLDRTPPNNPAFKWLHWYCPGPADPTQYAFINYTWEYSLPRPNGPEGYSQSALLVDPDNRAPESNEVNNVYVVSRPNPHQTVLQGSGNPDLIVSSVTVGPYVESGHGRSLNIRVKNVGSRTAYSCGKKISNSDQSSGAELLHGYVDGSDHFVPHGHTTANSLMIWHGVFYTPLTLHPGQELEESFFLTDATQDQYGAWYAGLQSGCHEVRLVVNRESEFEGERACNNETFFYFPSGGASCSSTQVMRTSSCSLLQGQPISRQKEILRSPSQPPSLPQQKKITR